MAIMTVLFLKVFKHIGWSSFILPTMQYVKGILERYVKTQFNVIYKDIINLVWHVGVSYK